MFGRKVIMVTRNAKASIDLSSLCFMQLADDHLQE
jgi:hypothetical protein